MARGRCSGWWVVTAAGAARLWVLSALWLGVLMDLCRLLKCKGRFISKQTPYISKT